MSSVRGGAQGVDARHLPVDAHVHFYRPERVAPTLQAALENFLYVIPRDAGCAGALLLTQASHEQVFETLRQAPGTYGDWQIESSEAEGQSVVAARGDHWIALVAGSQIRCDNGLEVAALGTAQRFPDGLSLEATLDQVSTSGALVVLPWGFGKWTGSRGRQIAALLGAEHAGRLAVGDNGSRLRVLGRPSLIRRAALLGHRVLPGTDPFPCSDDYRRVGSFGCLIDADPDRARPWASLSAALAADGPGPEAFGEAVSPAVFLRNQIGIRLFNRRLRRSA